MGGRGNKKFLVDLYAAYAAGDPQPSIAAAHDEIIFEFVGPTAIFPFCGPRRGKQDMIEALKLLNAQFVLRSMDIDRVLVDGNDFCVQMKIALVDRVSGASFRGDLVDMGQLQDTRIVSLKAYWDVENAARQLSGRKLALGPPIHA
jgi:ketosteroid isomerase-like protein